MIEGTAVRLSRIARIGILRMHVTLDNDVDVPVLLLAFNNLRLDRSLGHGRQALLRQVVRIRLSSVPSALENQCK